MQKLMELLAEQNSISVGFAADDLLRFEAPGWFFAGVMIIAVCAISDFLLTR